MASVLSVVLLWAASCVARAEEPVHLELADHWVETLDPALNAYGSPSTITVPPEGSIVATTTCSGFVALLIRDADPVITASSLRTLVGSSLPTAAQWTDAIVGERTAPVSGGTVALHLRATADEIAPGDLLSSSYTSAGGTGHTMLVDAVDPPDRGLPSPIPGVAAVDRYLVTVVDSTSSVHGHLSGTDTRLGADLDADGFPVDDHGLGRGQIDLYADDATGELVGWTWSTTSREVYQGTDPEAAGYRPIVAGYLTGPGI